MDQLLHREDPETRYRYLHHAVQDLLQTETDLIAALANVSALIYAYVERINWAGFYILKENVLVLGPFQGKPACARIPLDKGVCGCAARESRIVIVGDVHSFPGHIACDSNSLSEIVLPVTAGDQLFGVLDVDSPELGRFSALEEGCFSEIVLCLNKFLSAF